MYEIKDYGIDTSHWQFYIDKSEEALKKHSDYGNLNILKTDAYNEILDLPIEGGVLGNIFNMGRSTIVEYEDVFYRKAKNMGFDCVRGDVRDLPFSIGDFDAILDLSTIDHIHPKDLLIVFNEYHRVLTLGGILFLVTWVAENPDVNSLYKHEGGGWTPRDQYFFDPDMFRKKLKSVFKVNKEFKYKDDNTDSYMLCFECEKR